MRIQVEYDSTGKIRSIAGTGGIDFPDGSRGMMGRFPSEGHSTVELEVEDIRDERDIAGFMRVLSGYRITGHPDEPHLTATEA
jgi:hypothetical protein